MALRIRKNSYKYITISNYQKILNNDKQTSPIDN